MTDDYIQPTQLRDWINSSTTTSDGAVQAACTVASRAVEKLCGRYFYQDGSATARYFPVDDNWYARVDDISTTTGLLVATDDAYDGTYSTSWTITTDFTLEPINPSSTGVTVPWTQICATGANKIFPKSYWGRPNPLKVTAKWGWASVPDDVVHATRIYAAWLFKQKDAPDGFVNVDGWGPRFMRDNPSVRTLLGPYMRNVISVA